MSNENLPIAYRYSVQDVSEMARAVAQSRMFGMDQAQAMTLMLLAQAKGIHPIQAVERYHVIQGRPAMKADAMLADFQAAGGTVEWTERSEKAWEGTFTHPTHAPNGLPVRFTLDDAKRAGLLNNPTWTKYPGNMLRARVISNAIRTIMPGIVAGIYTPEEASDMEFPQIPSEPSLHRTEPSPRRERIIHGANPEVSEPRKPSDQRSLSEIIQAGVDKVNNQFAEEHENAEPIINGFEVQRHLLKAAIAEGQIPDPGKVAQGRCHVLLVDFYRTPEGRHWIRRNLGSYLVHRLQEAQDQVSKRDEVESIEEEAVSAEIQEREPGEDG